MLANELLRRKMDCSEAVGRGERLRAACRPLPHQKAAHLIKIFETGKIAQKANIRPICVVNLGGSFNALQPLHFNGLRFGNAFLVATARLEG